jgi:uncharacterized protein YutE (UPF0331/DUF86 family)
MSKDNFKSLEELIAEYVNLIISSENQNSLGKHIKLEEYKKLSKDIRDKIKEIKNSKDEKDEIRHIVEFTMPYGAISPIIVKYNNEEDIEVEPPKKAYLHSYSNSARLTSILLNTQANKLDGKNVLKYGDLIIEYLEFLKNKNIKDIKAEDFWNDDRIQKYIKDPKAKFLDSRVLAPFDELKFWYFSANKEDKNYDKFPLENGSLKNALRYLKNIFEDKTIDAEKLKSIFDEKIKEKPAAEKNKLTLPIYLYIDQLTNLIDKLKVNEIPKNDDDISKFYQKVWETIKDEKIKEEVAKMNKFRNIIYHGAPGTGKTYELIKEVDNFIEAFNLTSNVKGKREFIQFHGSYYYEDFIGGLKPTNNNGISLKYKNGIFKKLCRKAAEYEVALYNLFKDKTRYKDTIAKNPTWNELVKQELVEDTDNINNLKINKDKEILSQFPPFFLIIDEINRADLSKVFGELLFAIEDDYRGIENKFKLSSSNIETKDSAVYWKDDEEKGEAYFFVPKNLYIRGTMNDIDKSVDSIDFAFRRRFKWEEKKFDLKKIKDIIESKGYENIDIKDYINKCKKLNTEIKDKISIADESYEIGHAIFANITKYLNDRNEITKNSKTQLFNNHIESILYNYLKMDYGNANSDVNSFRDKFI